MGLDTSHNCWHGPYGAFSRWRQIVAESAGYVYWPVKDGDYTHDVAMIDWGHLKIDNPHHLDGEWNKPPDDPLIVLIAHQDCEGVIHPEQAAALADRLEALLPLVPTSSSVLHGNPRAKTEQFMNGLRDAVAKNEDVEFF